MEVNKTIKAKVLNPTNRKFGKLEELKEEWEEAKELEREYNNLREKTDLPAFYCRALGWKANKDEDVSILLDNESLVIEDTGNEYARFFANIKVMGGRGSRVWVPLRMWEKHEKLIEKEEIEICNSKIIKKDDGFYLHIAIKKEIKLTPKSNVIGVDLGEKVLATSVALTGSSDSKTIEEPEFHGREAGGVRRKYAWLRKKLGEKKAYKKYKEIGGKEERRIDQMCHKISKEIVEKAERLDAVIVVGNLKGIGNKDTGKGKIVNRIVNFMPYGKLTRYIEYKALWKGIPVVKADESYTSQKCHKCGRKGKRLSQGLFKCPNCGLEYNADLNGAINIASEFFDQWLRNGAVGLSARKGGEKSTTQAHKQKPSQKVYEVCKSQSQRFNHI